MNQATLMRIRDWFVVVLMAYTVIALGCGVFSIIKYVAVGGGCK